MGRFRAATRVAAFFIIAVCGSPLAQACEACERVPLAPGNPGLVDTPHNIGRLDVTAAVQAATSFVIETVRGLRWFSRRGEVVIHEHELGALADISNGSDVIVPSDAPLNAIDYVASYETGGTQGAARMPNFQREHKWALTYRSDAADAIAQPAQSDRFPGMNTTLDDSIVVGLRFELDYGWKR